MGSSPAGLVIYQSGPKGQWSKLGCVIVEACQKGRMVIPVEVRRRGLPAEGWSDPSRTKLNRGRAELIRAEPALLVQPSSHHLSVLL